MAADVQRWRFESEHCSCARDKIDLLLRLIDCHVPLALLICDDEARVLWANEYALSAGQHWRLFCAVGDNTLITDEKLKQVVTGAAPGAPGIAVRNHFARGRLFFEISRLAVPESQLIGLAIDCHTLAGSGGHTLDELSPSEYDLIKCLEHHYTLKESASRLNISYENARTKLKRIFDKLDVHSQRELVNSVRHID